MAETQLTSVLHCIASCFRLVMFWRCAIEPGDQALSVFTKHGAKVIQNFKNRLANKKASKSD